MISFSCFHSILGCRQASQIWALLGKSKKYKIQDKMGNHLLDHAVKLVQEGTFVSVLDNIDKRQFSFCDTFYNNFLCQILQDMSTNMAMLANGISLAQSSLSSIQSRLANLEAFFFYSPSMTNLMTVDIAASGIDSYLICR